MNFSLEGIVYSLIRFYSLAIFVYVILSWFPGSGVVADLRRVLGSIVEPYVGLFRRFMPSMGMGGAAMDFSPLVAYLVLQIVVQPVLLYIVRLLG